MTSEELRKITIEHAGDHHHVDPWDAGAGSGFLGGGAAGGWGAGLGAEAASQARSRRVSACSGFGARLALLSEVGSTLVGVGGGWRIWGACFLSMTPPSCCLVLRRFVFFYVLSGFVVESVLRLLVSRACLWFSSRHGIKAELALACSTKNKHLIIVMGNLHHSVSPEDIPTG